MASCFARQLLDRKMRDAETAMMWSNCEADMAMSVMGAAGGTGKEGQCLSGVGERTRECLSTSGIMQPSRSCAPGA